MGKRGSWFSAIKRFCTSSNSKQKKPVNEAEKKSLKKHGGGNRSFIPLFREPSSIEKILGEVDQQNLFMAHPHPPTLSQQSSETQQTGRPQSPPPPPSPRATSPPPPPPPPRVAHQQTKIISDRPEPTLQQRHLSATRIQAAYRGYMERRKLRGLTGLVRLQGVVRGQHVKRQTVNAMKQMQLLVRLQTQIQSRRMQTIEKQALKCQAQKASASASASWVGKNQLEMGDEDWDASLITKEEREARLHRKVEALNKRERAMAYANSHQVELWKAAPKSAQNTLMGYPWWWNWLERQLPLNSQSAVENHQLTTPSPQSSLGRQKQAIRPSSSSSSPSTRSMAPSRTRQQMTPPPPSRMMKFSKPRARGGSPYPVKDDDSLMSCPPFSVPNYMSPTLSAKAKARPTSNPKDRMPGTPGSISMSVSSQRRFSFPATPSTRGGSRKSPGSVGDFSVDSSFSIGRKPFNRFV
ncbi:unnamed protein product [Lactuca virosa]|uniref:DUF4005 domain-containing protein n=1 Tax=Lactuca virosa TaxID=75947 RepID=A0AAU9PSM2_9ASTR|nr:unnamed protein product [Lactuca virosa]